ncbi:hypothetical protein C1645_762886 [Glomus cerebriforme]|uniref:Uncharacterized protein n=1 Tax=Glomus cerebriforme TaxID=658196 RepID=A0A397TAF3_9GLOM|nr:hypothetical protein C1645_762886 [Glomus cerebriforme]
MQIVYSNDKDLLYSLGKALKACIIMCDIMIILIRELIFFLYVQSWINPVIGCHQKFHIIYLFILSHLHFFLTTWPS